MGDFNLNLLKNNEHSSSFEENILCNGFSPIISTPTHHKPNCQDTCIDNILVNNHDKVLRNGTLETHISHHKSVFIIYNTSIIAPSLRDKKTSITVKYDFNISNYEKLRNALTTKVSTITEDNYTFEQFICMLNKFIDYSCKLNIPTHSK